MRAVFATATLSAAFAAAPAWADATLTIATVNNGDMIVMQKYAPRFEQVVTILIDNAVKYSPHQTPVMVSVWEQDGEAMLSVKDRGIGIPVQDQPLVFERFHRARNVDDRRFAGMGLGLYVARGIVEQHSGRIWLQSTSGFGSTFFVAMPRAPGPAPQAADIRNGSLASA